MTREPDRSDKQGEELACAYHTARCRDRSALARQIAAALRREREEALERAADVADSYGCDYAARSIRILASPAAAPAAEPLRDASTGRTAAEEMRVAGIDVLRGIATPSEPVAPAPDAHLQSPEIARAPAPDLRALVVEALDIQDDCDHPPGCDCPWCQWAWRAAKTIASKRGVAPSAAEKRIAELEAALRSIACWDTGATPHALSRIARDALASPVAQGKEPAS